MKFYIRLLNVHNLTLGEFEHTEVPPYVTASHRWTEDEDPFLDAARTEFNTRSNAFKKVRGFCDAVKRRNATTRMEFVRKRAGRKNPIDWLWIDTCSIDYRNKQEVSESIASMYRYYESGQECFAYLADVSPNDDVSFRRSEWFFRGWTLQELLAPRLVIFFAEDWSVLGHKCPVGGDLVACLSGWGREHVNVAVAEITSIAVSVLDGTQHPTKAALEDKILWVRKQKNHQGRGSSELSAGIIWDSLVHSGRGTRHWEQVLE